VVWVPGSEKEELISRKIRIRPGNERKKEAGPAESKGKGGSKTKGIQLQGGGRTYELALGLGMLHEANPKTKAVQGSGESHESSTDQVFRSCPFKKGR